jgi:4'-phosphopantetheinyl transferase
MNNEIHIWYASLCQSVSYYHILSQTLSLDEHRRAERFYFERDKKRFVICHGILRMLLAHYLSVKPGKLQFYSGKYGKPALVDTFGRGKLFFNLSRSGDHALYAFTRDREIGIDIEQIRNISEMNQIAERVFSKKEREAFFSLSEKKKEEAFFNCWTRKEAFVKAIGDGLYHALDTFEVSFLPGKLAMLLGMEGCPMATSQWSIQELNPTSGCAAAFAVKGQDWRLCHYQYPHLLIGEK